MLSSESDVKVNFRTLGVGDLNSDGNDDITRTIPPASVVRGPL